MPLRPHNKYHAATSGLSSAPGYVPSEETWTDPCPIACYVLRRHVLEETVSSVGAHVIPEGASTI